MKNKKHTGAQTPEYRAPTPPPGFVPPPSKKVKETRKCLVAGQQAIFHRWADVDSIILKASKYQFSDEVRYLQKQYAETGIIPGGMDAERVRTVKALVELSNGQVAFVDVEKIQFIEE